MKELLHVITDPINHSISDSLQSNSTVNVKTIEIDRNAWPTYLGQKIFAKYHNYLRTNHGKEPQYIIMTIKDWYDLRATSLTYNNVHIGYDGFKKYNGMNIITTQDLVEGEILIL